MGVIRSTGPIVRGVPDDIEKVKLSNRSLPGGGRAASKWDIVSTV